MSILSGDAATLTRTRSARRARTAWGVLVDAQGERSAFSELSAHAGGSDAAFRTLRRHGIATDLG